MIRQGGFDSAGLSQQLKGLHPATAILTGPKKGQAVIFSQPAPSFFGKQIP